MEQHCVPKVLVDVYNQYPFKILKARAQGCWHGLLMVETGGHTKIDLDKNPPVGFLWCQHLQIFF